MSSNCETGENAVAAFLSSAEAYGTEDPVDVIETHISYVFLTGERAYKMKKPVRLAYLDYSTLEQRRLSCLTEVEINSRTAPEIYQGVAAVRRDGRGALTLEGDGEVVEWLVEMHRFDDDQRLDRLLSTTKLSRHLFVDLADHIAAFHRDAEVSRQDGDGARVLQIRENVATSLRDKPGVLAAADITAWDERGKSAFESLTTEFDERMARGTVRHCHGDMHLANICVVNGEPLLFDGIEFNEAYSWIDVGYDLAFVIMDLVFREEIRFASVLMNRYFDVTGDVAERPHTLAVLPVFLSLRAAVRAHVSAAQSELAAGSDDAARLNVDAQHYLQSALDYLEPSQPRLLAVGGLSGSGKSRMAREIAPYIGASPGARVVRTDAVRKRIAGAQQEQRLGAEAYTSEMHERTYDAFYGEARAALAQGRSVVLDAVFPAPGQRQRAEELAREMNVPFQGLWIEAPEDVRVSRVTSRQRNISDVTEEIARGQSSFELGEIAWTRIDSSGPKEETLSRGLQVIGVI